MKYLRKSFMENCQNTGFRSVKLYNNRISKHANEFIIYGAIKNLVYMKIKNANKQTNRILTSNLKV